MRIRPTGGSRVNHGAAIDGAASHIYKVGRMQV